MQFLFKCLIMLSAMTVQVHAADKAKFDAKPAKPVTNPLPEMSMGDSKAPVTIIEYSSLTCGHCAQFHTNVLPQIQQKYINPGKVRIVFRDYPGDQVSLQAHQVAWCKGGIKYMDFMKLLYSSQEKWLTASDPLAALKSIAAQNGIPEKQFDACITDQELLDKIIQVRLEGQKKYHITATPTIVINAKIYPQALTFEEFEKIIKPLLEPAAEKNKNPTLEKVEKSPSTAEKNKQSFWEAIKKTTVEEPKKSTAEEVKKPTLEKVKKE